MDYMIIGKLKALSDGRLAGFATGFPIGLRYFIISPICIKSSIPKRLMNITEPMGKTSGAVNSRDNKRFSMDSVEI